MKTLLVFLDFFTLNFLMAFSTQKYKNLWEIVEINYILTLIMTIFKLSNTVVSCSFSY